MCGIQSSHNIYSSDIIFFSIINSVLNYTLVAKLSLKPMRSPNPQHSRKEGHFWETAHPLPNHISRHHPSKTGRRKKSLGGISKAEDKHKLLERHDDQ